MSDHSWILENLEAYLADGLGADERLRIDRHVTGCKECAAALTEQRGLDQTLRSLFADVRPAPGLESRMIQGLRVRSRRVVPSSRLLRVAACAAAVLLLGTIGLIVQALGLEDNLQLPGNARKHSTAEGYFQSSHARTGDGELFPKHPIKRDKAVAGNSGDGTVVFDDSKSMESPDDVDKLTKRISVAEDKRKPTKGGGGKEQQEALDGLPARMKALESLEDDRDGKDLRKVFKNTLKETFKELPAASKVPPATTTAPPNDRLPPVPPALPEASVTKEPKGGGDVKEPPPGPGEGKLGDPKTTSYYEPSGSKAGSKDPGQGKGGESEGDGKDKDSQERGRRKEDKSDSQGEKEPKSEQTENKKRAQDAEFNGKKPEEKLGPAPAARKIIRSGDIEFEIDKFDPAVATVTRLVTAIPGAFVATRNSDKLPNGKVRGSMVVRMPPEKLDAFLLNVRQELGKVGELKNERIGSQDVSKTYYDIESRLKGARITEERLINIIKSGKGEIKDVLAAERQLSEWHTKIEEMEGEIRYYNNQVSLSTLTISLYEKEIRAAAAMVISERVNMKIEAEDVEKALQTALTAVTEAKGRVTRSDLKQHAAGQYEAILHFEVAPTSADKVRAKLRTLGVVAHQDAERLQQAEGGTTTTGDIKMRQNDVQFQVVLYNVANIQPREAYSMQIATPEVAVEYRKLQDEVAKLKGQVRLGQLNEQDKLNVTAQFDFDVPTPARAAIEKLLATLGEVLGRNTTRAGPGETATDTKVGYRVTLKTYAGIPARDTFVFQIAAQDVPADYRKLQDAVAAAKGQIRSGNLNEQDRLNVSAQLDFDVPAGQRESVDKLLTGIGDVLGRTTTRKAPGETATNTKVGYSVTLKNFASIPPRETYVLQAVSLDVSGSYRKLQDTVAEVSGQIRSANLNEQDKANVSADVEFNVPTSARTNIDKLLTEIGEVYSRTTNRAAPGDAATDRKVGYRLTLKNVAGMAPRERVKLGIEVKDVEQTAGTLKDMVKAKAGAVTAEQESQKANGQVTRILLFDVPLTAKDELVRKFRGVGTVRVSEATLNPQVPETKLATAHLDVTLSSTGPIVPSDEGLWPQIRTSLFYSFKVLSYSLSVIILGLSVVLPWALVLWVTVKVVRRWRKKPEMAAA